jgi:hypothetical protein
VVTLAETIQVAPEIVPPLAEQIYQLYAPHKPFPETLNLIVTELQKRRIRYPAVLLKRLKELQRGEWAPSPTPTITLKRTLVTCPDCGFQNDSLTPKGWLASHPCPARPRKALATVEQKKVGT